MKTKIIPKEKLVVRESFSLAFAGGEIWIENLDALSIYTDVAEKKFLKDMESIRKPSCSAFLCIHLAETLVNQELAQEIVQQLAGAKRRFMKVVFVGLDSTGKKRLRALLRQYRCPFAYEFIDDLQKAKEWLLNVKH